MMNFQRPDIKEEELPRIMSRYPFGQVFECHALGGVPNRTYKIVTPTKVLAVRICNNGYTSQEHLDFELSVLQHLVDAGYRYSPRLIRGNDGKVIQFWNGYRVVAMDYISGTCGDSVDLTPGLCSDVGSATAQLHTALNSYREPIPSTETFFPRGERLLAELPRCIQEVGWEIDAGLLVREWQSSVESFARASPQVPLSILHTDIWPPNIICSHGRLMGIIDYDDCAYGPTILDLCAILVEFPWFNTLTFQYDLATTLLHSYLLAGRSLSTVELSLIIDGMKLSCISWLACNAVHGVDYDASKIYEQKLLRLAEARFANALQAELVSIAASAIA